jgi:ubiquinone/menaquinone biosynthesis C-methylase UbiE
MLRTRLAWRQVRSRSLRRHLQRVAFALLYRRAARFYDRFTVWLFLGEWERWQLAALDHLPTRGLAVEIGCGTGSLMWRGCGPNRHWIGVDSSPEMMRVAAKRRGADSSLVRADAGRLPVPDERASAVVATFPTPTIVGPRSVAEMRRVLAPRGIVVIVLSGELAAHGPRRRLRRAALRLFYGAGATSATIAFRLSGFDGGIQQDATPHGVATIYVGRKSEPEN